MAMTATRSPGASSDSRCTTPRSRAADTALPMAMTRPARPPCTRTRPPASSRSQKSQAPERATRSSTQPPSAAYRADGPADAGTLRQRRRDRVALLDDAPDDLDLPALGEVGYRRRRQARGDARPARAAGGAVPPGGAGDGDEDDVPSSRTRGYASSPCARHNRERLSRPLRSVTDGRPAPRRGAHGAGRVAGGARGRRRLRHAHRGSRPGRAPSGAEERTAEDLACSAWTGTKPDVGGPHAPYRQSLRLARYDAAVERLLADGRAFRCWCSRAEVARAAAAPHGPADDGPRYPGTCRARTTPPPRDRRPSVRLRVDARARRIHRRRARPARGRSRRRDRRLHHPPRRRHPRLSARRRRRRRGHGHHRGRARRRPRRLDRAPAAPLSRARPGRAALLPRARSSSAPTAHASPSATAPSPYARSPSAAARPPRSSGGSRTPSAFCPSPSPPRHNRWSPILRSRVSRPRRRRSIPRHSSEAATSSATASRAPRDPRAAS